VFASVLISVYHKETPGNLAAALESILSQTRLPDEIVLVKDGPLPKSLDAVIDEFRSKHTTLFNVISLPENQGLPTALNHGLQVVKGDVLLRMDSDDISHPERFSQQLAYLETHQDIDVLGTAMWEFSGDHRLADRIKPVREHHDAIKAALVYRNPINHPTVCCRTQAIKAVGGYPQLRYVEDYLLWVRMIHAGYHFHNLPQPLHYQRFDEGTIRRRGGGENFSHELQVRREIYASGLSGLLSTIIAMLAQVILRLFPARFRMAIWQLTRNKT